MKKILYVSLVTLSLLFFWGCAEKRIKSSPRIDIKETVYRADISNLFPGKFVSFGDNSYSLVNMAALDRWRSNFENVLFILGTPAKWRENFDCNRFSLFKMGVGQVMYFVDSFHTSNAAQSIAIGEFWYSPDGLPQKLVDIGNGQKILTKQGHAINVIITKENDKVVAKFVDIYTGKIMNLSVTEINSAYLIKF